MLRRMWERRGEVSTVVNEFTIDIEQQQDYKFQVRFDKPQHPAMMVDEPAPLGNDTAPNPARVLAAAVGNCLSASLLFCSRKAKTQIGPIKSRVHAQIVRNESGRLRIGKMRVEIDANVPEGEQDKAKHCLGVFEDYCMVTQSVRQGFPIEVSVKGDPVIGYRGFLGGCLPVITPEGSTSRPIPRAISCGMPDSP